MKQSRNQTNESEEGRKTKKQEREMNMATRRDEKPVARRQGKLMRVKGGVADEVKINVAETADRRSTQAKRKGAGAEAGGIELSTTTQQMVEEEKTENQERITKEETQTRASSRASTKTPDGAVTAGAAVGAFGTGPLGALVGAVVAGASATLDNSTGERVRAVGRVGSHTVVEAIAYPLHKKNEEGGGAEEEEAYIVTDSNIHQRKDGKARSDGSGNSQRPSINSANGQAVEIITNPLQNTEGKNTEYHSKEKEREQQEVSSL
jgi:hypothetical protein